MIKSKHKIILIILLVGLTVERSHALKRLCWDGPEKSYQDLYEGSKWNKVDWVEGCSGSGCSKGGDFDPGYVWNNCYENDGTDSYGYFREADLEYFRCSSVGSGCGCLTTPWVDQTTVRIYGPKDHDLNYTGGDVCIDDPSHVDMGQYTDGPSPTYSGPGISGGGSWFDVAAAGTGQHTITATWSIGPGCSSYTSSTTITVRSKPNATWSSSFPTGKLDSDPAFDIQSYPGGWNGSRDELLGPGVFNDHFLDPSIAGDGTHDIDYVERTSYGCDDTATQSITITHDPGVPNLPEYQRTETVVGYVELECGGITDWAFVDNPQYSSYNWYQKTGQGGLDTLLYDNSATSMPVTLPDTNIDVTHDLYVSANSSIGEEGPKRRIRYIVVSDPDPEVYNPDTVTTRDSAFIEVTTGPDLMHGANDKYRRFILDEGGAVLDTTNRTVWNGSVFDTIRGVHVNPPVPSTKIHIQTIDSMWFGLIGKGCTCPSNEKDSVEVVKKPKIPKKPEFVRDTLNSGRILDVGCQDEGVVFEVDSPGPSTGFFSRKYNWYSRAVGLTATDTIHYNSSVDQYATSLPDSSIRILWEVGVSATNSIGEEGPRRIIRYHVYPHPDTNVFTMDSICSGDTVEISKSTGTTHITGNGNDSLRRRFVFKGPFGTILDTTNRLEYNSGTGQMDTVRSVEDVVTSKVHPIFVQTYDSVSFPVIGKGAKCVANGLDAVQVIHKPEPEFVVTKYYPDQGEIVEFQDSSDFVGTGTTTYQYWFGDGLQSNQKEPWHYYYTPGYMDVKLSILGPYGCSDTTEEDSLIFVKASSSIEEEEGYPGSAEVSPNPFESGLKVELPGEENTRGKMTLYDLNGNVVRRTQEIRGNGFFNTEGIERGTYFLKVEHNGIVENHKVISK